MIRRLASLHWLQPGTVHQLHGYYQDALTSCRPSRRPSLPSIGGTTGALVSFRSRHHRVLRCAGLELVTRYLQPGFLPRRRQDLPSSWEISIVRLHVFLPTPAGLLAPDQYGAAAWPLDPQVQRLPQLVFRRSITWLSDSLSTLRRVRYLTTTQDSLPVAGQALPGGLSTHKISLRGFRFASYISSSSPKLCLAQWHRPPAISGSGQTAGGGADLRAEPQPACVRSRSHLCAQRRSARLRLVRQVSGS